MTSVSQEQLCPQVVQAMQTVLCEAASRLERSSGLIRRQGKVTGANLAQTLVLGWLADPAASLEQLAQQAASVGLAISAQGLDERFTMRAVAFFQALWEEALGQLVLADPIAIPLVERFAAVCVEDSTTIRLPEELAEMFAGNGGAAGGAACKLFVRWDLRRGQLRCSQLQPGRTADGASPLKTVPVPQHTLHLRDLGFVDVPRWRQEQERGEWVLSALRTDLALYDLQGQPLDLVQQLPQAADYGEWQVLVGAKERLPMRLFFLRVPEAIARERRRKRRREAQSRGQQYSKRAEFLAGWTLVVTTVPNAWLRLPEALVLLRARWQIELLFKLFKQQGLLDAWRTKKPARILCEVFAKLIGLLIQHWLLLISCWQDPHRSLPKAAKVVRQHVVLLSAALMGEIDWGPVLQRIQRVAQVGSRLNMRRRVPNTSQQLQTGWPVWSDQPLRHRRWR